MALLSKLFKKLEGEQEGKLVKEWDFLADDIITTSPAVSKDNSLIVFGTKSGKIYALDHNGSKVWEYTIEQKLGKEELIFLEEEKFKQVSAEPVIADIDNDGRDEIIICSEIGALFVLNHKGKLLWNFSSEDAIKASALVADVNKNKKLEIIFGSNDSLIYCLDSKGKLLWKNLPHWNPPPLKWWRHWERFFRPRSARKSAGHSTRPEVRNRPRQY